jgi:ESCRT-I complex subunit TSG101
MSSLTTRQNQLLAIRDDLASAPAAIEDEMGRLKAVRDVCIGVGERIGAVVREAEERVSGNGPGGKREEVSVDEVVCSTTIVYNQSVPVIHPRGHQSRDAVADLFFRVLRRLIDLVAEDAAISDTLYQLNRALHNEKIDLERFLKATRILAREQFMKRALVERILKG